MTAGGGASGQVVSGGAAEAEAIDPRAFRRTMGLFATGVTVITVRVGDLTHGMTAHSVTSVSLDPLLVLVCVDRRARMCGLIQQAGEFAINILSDAQESISRYFAGAKTGPEPTSLSFDRGEPDGPPFIHGALAAIDCRVQSIVDGGDHVIVLGRVTRLQSGAPGEPLIYFAGRYRCLRELEGVIGPPEVWNNDAVQIFHEAWADPVDECHPMA